MAARAIVCGQSSAVLCYGRRLEAVEECGGTLGVREQVIV
jgi:hypothetical protein